ncbi:hypothetical protein EHB58_09640 [Salmonella enterica subsp. enterica serovar Hull]|uniref:Uncharacterized protein n=1 Tax=Salmonella enterica subsp. enterica serovar Hull TaxID=1403564 RepID=A0A5X4PE70_SALET|nr:hypothetical protein [Salmonella enterica subsp. enterica serovar Hull]EBZ8648473.1 hypothetical protein [Salmonella enterica subsp. enterica serovar Hull]
MKNTVPSEEVQMELKYHSERLFQLCVENNIPLVACYSFEISRDETGYRTSRALTAYVDKESGVWDSTIAAASIMLRLKKVPEQAIQTMAEMAEFCDLMRAMSQNQKEKRPH